MLNLRSQWTACPNVWHISIKILATVLLKNPSHQKSIVQYLDKPDPIPCSTVFQCHRYMYHHLETDQCCSYGTHQKIWCAFAETTCATVLHFCYKDRHKHRSGREKQCSRRCTALQKLISSILHKKPSSKEEAFQFVAQLHHKHVFGKTFYRSFF